MRFKRSTLIILFCLALASVLSAQATRQTGVIKGVVLDMESNPLPGATVTASSPSLMGTVTSISASDGVYRLLGLPPGTYTVVAELTGFKTVRREGVIVQTGTVVTISIQTEPSAVAAEITVTAPAPTVDIQSNKVGSVLTSVLVQNLPLGRTMLGVFKTVAGANGTIDTYSGSIHGAMWGTTSYEIDGVNNNDPTHNGLLVRPQYDSIEEIDVTTGGLPAQIGNSGGSFVNIVTKSGGNSFHGQAQVYYTNEHLTQNLYPKIDLKAMGMGIPVLPKYDLDSSVSLGGPIFKDKLWFFGTIGLQKLERYTSFIPPTETTTIINGKTYTQYKDPYKELPFFLKLTTQVAKNMRLFAMINGSVMNRDVYLGGASRTAYDATFTLKNNTWVAATGEMNWILGANTYLNFRGGYTNRWYPITSRDESRDNRGYYDAYNRYTYNGITTNESYITRRTFQASARLNHFRDDFLGGDHEFGAGFEYQLNFDRYGYSRGNPITQTLYDGDFYSTNGRRYQGSTHPVYGDGLFSIAAMAPKAGGDGTTKDLPDYRLSGYIQDSVTIKQRLAVNVGVRFDYYNGYFGGGTSTGSTDPLVLAIGDQLNAGGAGYNPFAAFSFGDMKNLVKSSTFAPRIGISYDLFGDGKTALKASFGRYYEALPVMWYSAAQPGFGSIYSLFWFDLNGNKELDASDRYTPASGYGQFNPPDFEVLRGKITDDWKTPGNDEWTASISHELFRDFSVQLRYLHKRGFNHYYDWNYYGSNGGLYDWRVNRFWFNPDTAPAGYWVPYTTTVPAVGEFPAAEVTVWGATNDAPVDRLDARMGNNPDAKRKYDALELTFDKRYTKGWAIGGSVVYSKNKADRPLHPNDFMFYGENYDSVDTPLAIKLYGTINVPFGFIASFFLQHNEGTPYARSVWINFPQAFIDANNLWDTGTWAYIEPTGAHRYPSYDNLDVRLEKALKFKFGTVSLFADIFNLLGNKYVDIGRDPGGNWTPETGELTDLDYNYGRVIGVTGVRTYKFSARIVF